MTISCVASIRYWYPDIPIFLVIDYSSGPFNSRALCKKWNVKILDTGKQKYGWGFGKFEPLFLQYDEKFLVLDADTVLTGPVLDVVKNIDADFVVDNEIQPLEQFKSLYYDPILIKNIFPRFEYPGYSFNTGQWIGSSNILRKEDFDDLLIWTPSPRLRYPGQFKQADQGIFNFLIHRKETQKGITISRIQLMVWPNGRSADFINIESIIKMENKFPLIIHWAGMKFKRVSMLPRADILFFYRNFYYSRFGVIRRYIDSFYFRYLSFERKLKFSLKKLINRPQL